MNKLLYNPLLKRLLMPLLLLVCLLFSVQTKGQEKPPRPISVTVKVGRQLQFGSFIQAGSAGTVTVDHSSSRTSSGSVLIPTISSSSFPMSAMFIVDAEPGTLITIFKGYPVELVGSNGGKMTLTLGEASTSSPFITRDQITNVFIGGTLTVGSLLVDNPAGTYSGHFTVTFIQQ